MAEPVTGTGTPPVVSSGATAATGLFSVGPGANPVAYAPNPSIPPTGPDVSAGNVAGVWGYVGPLAGVPKQTSSPPITCGVFGEGGQYAQTVLSGQPAPASVVKTGVLGVNGFTGTIQASDTDPDGAGVLGYGGSHGVLGIGTSGNGVAGISDSGNGVRGISTSSNGVEGTSTGTGASGIGVLGTSAGTGTSCYGVWGQAANGIGVRGDTVNGTAGVCGSSSGTGLAGRFDGNVQINGTATAQDVVLSGADCAEQFDMHDATAPEPGTIVVIDDEGKLRESQSPYDRRVAGVVSGAGDYRPAIVLDRRASSEGRASVALVGKVFCKVDADPAPIAIGDLLTTSARPGFGMKATDSVQAFGAVIGKALRPLPSGQGMIPILVALQ